MNQFNHQRNRFTGVAAASDGQNIGESEHWSGDGKLAIVTLDNPGASAVIMQRLEYGMPDARWVNCGAVVVGNVQRPNLFVSGYEYRALIVSPGTEPARLNLRPWSQATYDFNDESLLHVLVSGSLQGFSDADPQGIVQYGDLEALRKTNALMFFCFDPDPEKQRVFGGAWEKSGVNYRKLHIDGLQYLRATAIEAYGDGTATPPSTPTTVDPDIVSGEVGGQPLARTGAPTLDGPAQDSVFLRLYTPRTGEAYWGSGPDATAEDQYEVALNGTVIYVGTAKLHGLSSLTPSTEYELSVVRFRADGSYSAPVTSSGITAAETVEPVDPVNPVDPAEPVDNTPPPGNGLPTPMNLEGFIFSATSGALQFGFPFDTTGITRYGIYANNTRVGSVTGGYASITDLVPNSVYRFGVRSENDAGLYSDVVYDETIHTTQPGTGAGAGTPTTGTGTETGGGAQPDGTVTTFPFYRFDAYTRAYVEGGATGQRWEQESSVSGFTGSGYLRTSAVDAGNGQGALAVYTGREATNVARRVWVRIRAEVAGDVVNACSHGNGALGSVTADGSDWQWVELSEQWLRDDASFQLHGISGGMLVDAVIAQAIEDTSVPSGAIGLRSA